MIETADSWLEMFQMPLPREFTARELLVADEGLTFICERGVESTTWDRVREIYLQDGRVRVVFQCPGGTYMALFPEVQGEDFETLQNWKSRLLWRQALCLAKRLGYQSGVGDHIDGRAKKRDYINGDEYIECTCPPECTSACKGTCGCDACTAAYADYLSGREA